MPYGWSTNSCRDYEVNISECEFDILGTHVGNDGPVIIRDTEPLTVAGTNVDVHRAEVAVLLVT